MSDAGKGCLSCLAKLGGLALGTFSLILLVVGVYTFWTSLSADGQPRCNGHIMYSGDVCYQYNQYGTVMGEETYEQQLAQAQADLQNQSSNRSTGIVETIFAVLGVIIGGFLINAPSLVNEPEVPKADRIKTALDRGNSLLRSSQYEQAVAAFEQVIALDPKNSGAYNRKGVALSELERWDEALAAFEQAIRCGPTEAVFLLKNRGYTSSTLLKNQRDFFVNKGAVLSRLERWEEALTAYELAIHLDPTRADVHNHKGDALCWLDRWDEALAAYELAVHLDPANALYFRDKGVVLCWLDRWDEALVAYEQAIHLDPTQADVYNLTGTALSRLERWDEALAAFEQALHLDPAEALYFRNKGVALFRLKRWDEALVAYELALHLDPASADVHHCKGEALLALKRWEEALVACEQAIHLDPTQAVFFNNKGTALRKLGRIIESEQAELHARTLEKKN